MVVSVLQILEFNMGAVVDLFLKVERLAPKWIGTRKLLFSQVSRFCPYMYRCAILETQKLFLKASFTHKTIFAPVHGLLEYLNKFWFQTYFGLQGTI